MKTLLTILFFVDTLVLILLSFLLLKTLDNGTSLGRLMFLLFCYTSCVLLMGFLLFRYLNLPVNEKKHSFFD